jgi:hypothetical protein
MPQAMHARFCLAQSVNVAPSRCCWERTTDDTLATDPCFRGSRSLQALSQHRRIANSRRGLTVGRSERGEDTRHPGQPCRCCAERAGFFYSRHEVNACAFAAQRGVRQRHTHVERAAETNAALAHAWWSWCGACGSRGAALAQKRATMPAITSAQRLHRPRFRTASSARRHPSTFCSLRLASLHTRIQQIRTSRPTSFSHTVLCAEHALVNGRMNAPPWALI